MLIDSEMQRNSNNSSHENTNNFSQDNTKHSSISFKVRI